METKRLTAADYLVAANLLKQGKLVAFPTETVYGLGADALNPQAVQQVYAVKHRPTDNPLNLTVSSFAMVKKYAAHIPDAAKLLMENFWPGPLTIILPLKYAAINKIVTNGLPTIAFRMPDNQATLQMITALGDPIVGPSANTSGRPSPTTAEHVLQDLGGKIAAVLDDGATNVGVDSTIIDMSLAQPMILRPGVITADEIADVIGQPVMMQKEAATGSQKYKHYEPQAQVIIVDKVSQFPQAIAQMEQTGEPFGIMATDQVLAQQHVVRFKEQFSLGDSVVSASQHLYDGLRYFDMYPEVKTILVQGFPATGIGIAYMNRLEKAAGHHHFFKKN